MYALCKQGLRKLTFHYIRQDDGEPVDNEYYNFLHVARTATEDEITAAYKKLTRYGVSFMEDLFY